MLTMQDRTTIFNMDSGEQFDVVYANLNNCSSNSSSNIYGLTHSGDVEFWLRTFWSKQVEYPTTRRGEPVYMWMRLVSLTLILVAGIPGNLLAICVMARPSLRRQPVSGRFAALAVCDLFCCLIRGITWIGLVYVFIGQSVPIQFNRDFSCGIIEHLFTSFHVAESWMVSYITLERAIVVVYPLKGSEICRQSLGMPLTLFCLLGPFILLGYLPFVTKFVPGIGCATKAFPDMLIHFVIATTAVSMVPLALIFVCNIAIIVALRRQLKMKKDNARSARFRRATNMVLAVSLVFLGTVFPAATKAMISVCLPNWKGLKVSEDLTAFLLDLNYAINFYLYIITGNNVRRELCAMFGCKAEPDEIQKNTLEK